MRRFSLAASGSAGAQRETGHALTDPWCLKLAAGHLTSMIESGEDLEKTLVTLSPEDLRRAAGILQPA